MSGYLDLCQDGMRMMFNGLPNYLIDKMVEIRSRTPELWEDKEWDLMAAAKLEIEQSITLNDDNRVFQFAEIKGKKGIYMSFNGKLTRVDHKDLLKLLWNSNLRNYLTGEPTDIEMGTYTVNVCFHKMIIDEYKECYFRLPFIESAKIALRDYCNAVNNREIDDYFDWNTKGVDRIERCLEHLKLPRNYKEILKEEIEIEPFYFLLQLQDNNEIKYSLSVSDRCFEYSLLPGFSSLHIICIQLEELIIKFPESGTLELLTKSGYSPLCIDFQNLTTYDTEEVISKVTIDPTLIDLSPIVFGYCDFKQVVKTIYLELLRFACEQNVIVYNSVQSSLIENFIKGVPIDELAYYPRQRFIENERSVSLDYENILKQLS